MPKSECTWLSLEAAVDELVSWYEKFGFFDMTCGHDDDPDAMTLMEMPNAPLVDTPQHRSRIQSSTSIVLTDADCEDETRVTSRQGSLRLSFSFEEGASEHELDAQPFSRQISLSVSEEGDCREGRSVSKKISIPRELWTQVARDL